MIKKYLPSLALASLVALASTASAQVYYLTFGNTVTSPFYETTTINSETWNSFDGTYFYDANNGAITISDATNSSTLGFAGVDTGLDAAVDWGEVNAASGTQPNPGSWYDSSVAAVGSFISFRNLTGTFKLTGLAATDTVDVQWIASRSGNNSREADFTIGGSFSNVISGNAVSSDDFVTNAEDGTYMEWSGLSADGSGELIFSATQTNNQYAVFGNALRIEVIPEPSTYALFAGALGLGLVLLRRRRS